MRLLGLLMGCAKSSRRLLPHAFILLFVIVAHAADRGTPWDAPAAELARRIADVLGPASAHLTIQNLSSIPNESLPVIRRQLEDGLKANGITVTNAESANLLRITLSENAGGGLWVAEVVEGNQSRVVMVTLNETPSSTPPPRQKVMLHIEAIANASDLRPKAAGPHDVKPSAIIAAAQSGNSLIVLTTERLSVFAQSSLGWSEQAHADLGPARAASRDPRGVVVPASDGTGFESYAPGVACVGILNTDSSASGSWSIQCHPSDDPWPLLESGSNPRTKAFYNSGRNYFTGVITPAFGADLPPFYSAAVLPARAAGSALLVGSVDGRILLVENGQIKPVTGARDWGSDFAVVSSSCGAGSQVIVSSSGEGTADSLRSYELPAQEAVAVSEPLMLNGTAMALWPASDAKSAIVLVRKFLSQGHAFDYEVDRVSESCN